jgi:hypothetical protein
LKLLKAALIKINALTHALQSAFKHVLKYCVRKREESSILSR